MAELREFARHSDDLKRFGVELVPISVDGQADARTAWAGAGEKQFTVLSDPGAVVIRRYGLLHIAGHDGADIALRTTILIGPDGRERWRRVSTAVPDIPTWDQTQDQILAAQHPPPLSPAGELSDLATRWSAKMRYPPDLVPAQLASRALRLSAEC